MIYFAIRGKPPPTSNTHRLKLEEYESLARIVASRYLERFLRAIDHALAVRREDRPQTVRELAEELGSLETARNRVMVTEATGAQTASPSYDMSGNSWAIAGAGFVLVNLYAIVGGSRRRRQRQRSGRAFQCDSSEPDDDGNQNQDQARRTVHVVRRAARAEARVDERDVGFQGGN